MNQTLEQMVSEHRASAGLIGLGAMVMQNGKVLASAVDGERKKGSSVALTVDDQWHLGSITKSMTATMIARLVERGKLSWSVSVGDVFADVENRHPQWQKVTLEDLLTHTSGAPSNFPLLTNFKHPAEGVARMTARKAAVVEVLRKKPQRQPGSVFSYSNVGYTIAGTMAEVVTGLSWETLIRQEVFAPLNIDSGGFGPPLDSDGELSQPRGHKRLFGFALAVGTDQDNSPIIGPAGTVHMNLLDLSRFANEHLKGTHGNGDLLTSDTYRKLHTPVLENYSFGWVTGAPTEMSVSPVIWHNGSNTMWYALITMIPSLNTVIAITSNDGNINKAELSAWKIVEQLLPLLSE